MIDILNIKVNDNALQNNLSLKMSRKFGYMQILWPFNFAMFATFFTTKSYTICSYLILRFSHKNRFYVNIRSELNEFSK